MGKEMQRIFNQMNMCFCGYEECEPGHSWGPGVRTEYIFHYISGGCGVFEISGIRYELSKGKGFLIPPDTVTKYCADKNDPWIYTWIAISGQQADLYFKSVGLTEETPIFENSDEGIEECLKMLINSFDAHENECRILSRLYEFLSRLMENSSDDNFQQSYITKALDFMKYNFSNGIRICDAAKFVGIDSGYMSKLFREQMNTTPIDYLTELRMKEAVRLMKNPALRLCDIAGNVGYSDQFVFSKAFVKYHGKSPSEYRKTI